MESIFTVSEAVRSKCASAELGRQLQYPVYNGEVVTVSKDECNDGNVEIISIHLFIHLFIILVPQ